MSMPSDPGLFRRGGSEDLYLGTWAATGAKVVIKYLRDFNNPKAREAFANQVRVLSRRYPGVVPLWSWDLAAARPNYVMPYLAGGSLAAQAGQLSDAQLLAIAGRLATTLSGMHANGDLDGDLKPENVLVDNAGEIWLADPIGNAAPPLSWFKPSQGGTPGYRAPEVRDGSPISAPADVYSFGATMYHLSTGNAPLDGERLDKIVETPWVNDALRQLVAICCNPNPQERPTMREVLRLLSGSQWTVVKAERDRGRAIAAISIVAVAIAFAIPLLCRDVTG